MKRKILLHIPFALIIAANICMILTDLKPANSLSRTQQQWVIVCLLITVYVYSHLIAKFEEHKAEDNDTKGNA